jgi:hypothetical protein
LDILVTVEDFRHRIRLDANRIPEVDGKDERFPARSRDQIVPDKDAALLQADLLKKATPSRSVRVIRTAFTQRMQTRSIPICSLS